MSDSSTSNPLSEVLARYFWRADADGRIPSIFSLLDSARNENIFPRLLRSDSDFLCLYRGEMEDDLADVAPYLVRLDRLSSLVPWLLANGFGRDWGIFVESDASLRALRRHFERFLTVYGEDGTPLFFRFYDPRVLRVYLPTCNAEELSLFFGPVNRFLIEDQDGRSLVEYALTGTSLTRKTVRVSDLP